MRVDRLEGLSVCCLTADEPAMVARMLLTVRDVADEIVVAVDSRVEPRRLRPLIDVCDRVIRFEYTDPVEVARPWMVEQCRHESVLMIDGDEVPSGALIDRLPTLVADEDPAQFRLARRWCFPDEGHWLAERPWWPDYQRRLVRHGPKLDFDLRVHGGVVAALPARYVNEALYHLALVLRPFADRRRRVREYSQARPGMVAVGGGPMNDTLYVPEHFATLTPAQTPSDDLARLREVLDARFRSDDAGRPPDLPFVTAAEIAASVPPDPLEAQGYRARLEVVELDLRTEPGNDTYVVVEITNEGDEVIPSEDSRGAQVRLGARLTAGSPAIPSQPWALTPLVCDVPVGESRSMETLVRIPGHPGTHTLEVDLVNERSRWFGCATRASLKVASRWERDSP